MRGLLEAEAVERWLERARGDAEFRALGRHLGSAIRFGDEAGGWVVAFRDGDPGPARDAAEPTARWDYELVAGEQDWRQILAGEMTLGQALSGIVGGARLRGDLVRAGGDTGALARLLELLPGHAPARRERPSAAGPFRHEIVGRYVEVGGIRTYYEEAGAEDAAVDYLLLHTAGHDGRQLQRLGDELAAGGRVLWPDFPAHGKIWPSAERRSLRTMEELDAFVDGFRAAVGLRRPTVVVGCSLGGNLTLAYAANHPGEVAAAIAFQGADFTPTQTETTLALLDHPYVNPADYGLERTRSLIGSRAPAEAAELVEWGTIGFTSKVVQTDLLAYGRFDLRERMGEIRCPLLLVRGQDDWLVGAEMVERAAERATAASPLRVVQPEGLGHYSPVEQPAEMAALATEFLAEAGVLPAGVASPPPGPTETPD